MFDLRSESPNGPPPALPVRKGLFALVLLAGLVVGCGSSDEKTTNASDGAPAFSGERPACYPDCRRADLTDARLMRVNLDGIDLTQARLERTILTDASLRNAKLVQARIYRASLADADLTNADLSKADLSRSSLRGANMTGAKLDFALFFQTTCPDGTQTAPPASKPPRCKTN